MRLFKFGECVAVLFSAGVVFFVANTIGSATRAAEPPIWTRDCTAKMDAMADQETVTCGKFTISRSVEHLAAQLGVPPKPIRCRAFQTRGIYGKIDLDCG